MAVPDTWKFLHHESIYVQQGKVGGSDIAAFDLDGTLIQSDNGLIYMRTEADWVPIVNWNKLIPFLQSLVDQNWTIVFFLNVLEKDPKYTRTVLSRIDNFINRVQWSIPGFEPFVYVSTRDNAYRKPNGTMFLEFINSNRIIKSTASFYCGDAQGPDSDNPLYRWSEEDKIFARAIYVEYYNPEEMLGTYEPEAIIPNKPLLIMAAHPSQYEYFVEDLISKNPKYVRTTAKGARKVIKKGNIPIIIGERLATRAGRNRMSTFLPGKIKGQILYFTRPIRPFVSEIEYKAADASIRGYANALDLHLQTITSTSEDDFIISRIN